MREEGVQRKSVMLTDQAWVLHIITLILHVTTLIQ